jgi:non-ribosomal peptide synthetase component F
LPQLPVQFADYAVWQQRTYHTWLEKHGTYWIKRLSGATHAEIPPDYSPSDLESPACKMVRLSFGRALTVRLHDLARRERLLLSIVILTAYIVVMSRWCNQRDVVIRFVSNGRYRPELANMVGLLINLLHLRVEMFDGENKLGLLRRVNSEFLSAYDHEDFNYVPDLVPECSPERSQELVFNWLPDYWVAQTTPDPDSACDHDVQIRPLLLTPVSAQKFSPIFSETASGVEVFVCYRADLFAPSTVESFGDQMRLAAQELVECPPDLCALSEHPRN